MSSATLSPPDLSLVDPGTDSEAATGAPRRWQRLASLIVLLAVVGVGVWAWRRGQLTGDAVGIWIRSLGWWSPPAFVAAFSAGQLLNLPGLAFVLAARLAYGPVPGFLLAYVGAVVAVSVPFLLARNLRSQRQRSWQPRWSWLRRILDGVERHPVRSVMLLRLVLWLSPPLAYALAFTGVRTRHYVLGSALGLLPFIAVAVTAIGLWR